MRDFSDRRSSSGSAVGSSAASEVGPGKSTLVRGLEAAEAAAPAREHAGDARGLKGGAPGEREVVRGGDAGTTPAPVGSGSGTPGPTPAPAPAPATAVTITSTTNAGPTFGPQGAAMWHVAFTTTGRTGWIVQKIDNTLAGTDAAGIAMTPASVGLAPHYYEAWSVSATGAVTPNVGGDNDHWDQGAMGARTKGSWSTAGALHWIPGAATPGGMAAGAVANAGMLVSSIGAPPGLGTALLHRSARATWDATVTPPVDTGTAH